MSEFVPFFVGWPIFILGYFVIRLINYKFNYKKQNKEKDISFKKTGLASSDIFVYNGMAYWIKDKKMYRANHEDRISVKTMQLVDPLNQRDLEIDEYMEILNRLEESAKQ